MALLSNKGSSTFDDMRDLYISMSTDELQLPRTPPQSSRELLSTNEDTNIDLKASWRSLFFFTTRKHATAIVYCVTTTVASGVLKPVAAIFFGKIFSILTQYGSGSLSAIETRHRISTWCAALTGTGAATWLIEGMFLSAWMVFGELQAKSVRQKMFSGLLEKEMGWYDLRKDGMGSLLIRIQTQIRELQLAVSQPLGFLLGDVIGALASLGTAFYFSWKLTLVIIAVIPVAAIALFLISMKLGPAIEAQKRELTQASKYANTAATEIDTVKAYNGQDQEVWQYYSTIKKAAAHYLTQATCNALQFGVIKLVMVGIFVQGFWYGIVLVRHGTDAGHILTTFYATINALVAIETVLPQWLVLVKGVSAGETLKSILLQMQRGRKITKMAGSIQPKYCHGDIEVHNVSFCYPSNPDQASLINSTFFFPAGETTFIVGRSGSGKSTLGNLLMKYYEPSSGEILIDGHPLATLELGWLRSNITLIQQQSVLFNETLLKNVAFGNRDHDNVPRESVMLACETANLEETLSELPDGVDTVVGSNIRPLSGGQQQRVSIARGRLRDAPILILDEGTSALDHASRKLVMEAIKKWRQGKTTIIITHDITQISTDDYVYVLESGMVVQEGYRKKLVEQAHGTFASFLLSDSDSDSDDSNCAEELPHSIDLRRKSEPASPTSPISPTYPTFYQEPTSSLDLDATPNSGYISKFFGIQGAESESPFDKAIAIQSNKRMSLGVGSLYVNDLRATNIWSSPMIPEEEKFPIFRPSFSRKIPNAVVIEELAPDERRNSIPTQSQRLPRRQILHPIETAPENFGKPTSLELVTTKTKDNQPKDQSSKKPASLRMILGTVWPTLVLRERVILILGFVAAFLVAAATPAFSYVFAKLLNVFYITENQTTEARKWALSMLAIAVVDGLASYSTHYALERSGQAWVNSLRVEALKRILCQPKAWFTKEKNSPARLNECLDRNAEEMRNLIGRFAGIAFTVVWMISISIVWSFMISWKLTFVALASSPVFYVVTRGFHLISSEWETKCNKASERATNIFTETFSNIRVVRALTLEEYFKKKHIKATDETYRVGISRAIYTGLLYGLSDAVSLFIVALVFYAGTVITTSGSITLSDCFQVVNLLLFGISNAGALLTLIPQISSSRATATHVLYLANMPRRASHEVYGTQRLTSIFPIQLNSLSFTYPDRPRTRTLDKISLTFDAGSCTAIVGPSGSGKSTIASILLGIYPPDISPHRPTLPLTFNYFSIHSCNIQNLRSQISIVSQNPTLFPATIAQNITYGLPEGSSLSSYQNIMAAAAEAGIHEYIMSLPSGYDTLIGEGGQGLSGGQAQRIAIARALLRRPKLLVLDEATSALDLESAEIIRDTIRRLKRQGGIAVVMITHNVEMMRIAERVVVLEGGKVVEEGGFGELSRNGGPFAKLIGRKVRKKRSPRTVFRRALSPHEGRTRESWIRQKSI